MPAVKASAGKRRRPSDKGERRFTVRRDSGKKRSLPHPVTVPRKARRAHNAFRMMVSVAIFCILTSTFLAWRRRTLKRRQLKNASFKIRTHFKTQAGSGLELAHSTEGSQEAGNRIVVNEEGLGNNKSISEPLANREFEADEGKDHASAAAVNAEQEESLSFEELPERIEWYSRADYKDGSRPMCRISKPYVLSNGTILVPEWMQKYERLLYRCGLGTHGFYSTASGPAGLQKTKDIEADFALTIHPEKFQEPTHDPSIYLTEHILKSSYLFDVFGGYARVEDGVKEHHCYTTENDSTCALPRPARSWLQPAVFVPKKIESAPDSFWPKQFVEMFGKAHGHGNGVIHLNASTLLIKSHKDQSEDLLGTCFRSIMTTDGMFRHLPSKALQTSNFYSEKNGISRSPKSKDDGSQCKISIGIASSGDPQQGIQATDDLKEKIEVLSKLALPDSSVMVKQVQFARSTSLKEHISEMQDLDIYIGASGEEMNSIGYLRLSATALELMPFGIKPTAHASLAHALGIQYEKVGGKPQVDDFKTCIDGEVFNLRKKGVLKFTENPEWQEPVVKAWDDAVSEFVLSGSAEFDFLTAAAPVNNYHARVCAQKQKIDISTDELARKAIRVAKNMCTA